MYIIFFHYILISCIMRTKRAISWENESSGICRQQRPISTCTSAQSNQGLPSLLTESFYTTGPSCSKLTTSLVNDSLKFTLSDTQIC